MPKAKDLFMPNRNPVAALIATIVGDRTEELLAALATGIFATTRAA